MCSTFVANAIQTQASCKDINSYCLSFIDIIEEILTVCGTPINRIDFFLPNRSDRNPKINTDAMAPKACNEHIHDFSSAVIGPDANGVSSDSSSNKFPPVHPITIPNIPAVKLTAIQNNKKNNQYFGKKKKLN